MIPKKANKLYKQLAEDLDIEEDLVDKFIEHYYKEVRLALTNLSEPRINLDGLGHFVVRSALVKSSIPKITDKLSNHDTSTFNAYHNKKGLELKLKQLKVLEKKIDIEEERKTNYKNIKDESSIKNNLGE
jgi:nucleoid DNA-binding protein